LWRAKGARERACGASKTRENALVIKPGAGFFREMRWQIVKHRADGSARERGFQKKCLWDKIKWVRHLEGPVSMSIVEVALLVADVGDDPDLKRRFNASSRGGLIIRNPPIRILP
jgi:hypothetical protein